MAFIDEAKFYVKAGDGGRGCVSFRREKFVPKGGPDGGDGGNGGQVIIEASNRLHSLLDFRYRSHFLAEKGVAGQGKKKHGRRGKDYILKVPVGSVLCDAETGDILVDLVNDGERFVAACGGRGGRGNCRFATSRNQAPRMADSGEAGEERWLKIELKLLADIGLVGLPNAGKSTLLSKLSAANPKVAPYPFTTLEPQLGVLKFDERSPCIIADIPGLIEDAHKGAGLGHKFLRHIERTRILLHVIDASGLQNGGQDPLAEYRVLEKELGCYNEELLDRRRIVLLNKIDLLKELDGLAGLREVFVREGLTVLSISALAGQGLGELRDLLAETLAELDDLENAVVDQTDDDHDFKE